MFSYLAFLIAFAFSLAAHAAQPAVDSSGPFFKSIGTTSSTTITGVTTTSAKDIVLVFVYAGSTSSQTLPSISSMSGCGLTWALRKRFTTTTDTAPDTNQDDEIWWAYASSPVSACTITISFASTIDTGDAIAFGVTNPASPTQPFDSQNPFTSLNNTLTPTVVTGISNTNLSPNLIFMFVGEAGDQRTGAGFSDTQGPCAGFIQYESFSNLGTTDDSTMQVIVLSVSTQQSGTAITLYSGGGATCLSNYKIATWLEISDSVTNEVAAQRFPHVWIHE